MRAGRQPTTLDTLRRFGRAHRRHLAQGLVGTMGVVLFRLAIPWPLRGVVEYAFPTGSRNDTVVGLLPAWGEPLLWLCGAYLLCVVCGGFSETVQRLGMVRFASRTVRDLRSAALQSAARRFRGVRAAAGDLIARLVADAGRLRADLTGILVHASKDGLLFLAVSALFLLWISPTMGVYFVVGGALTGWVGYRASRPMEAAARRARHHEGALAATIEQTLERGHLVPLAAAEDGDDDGGERGARSTRILGDASLAVHALLGLTVCLAVWTGVREVRAGELAPGELFLFIAYALMVHRRLVDAGRQLARVGKVRASVERLAPLLGAAGGDEEGRSRPLQNGVRIEGLRVEAVKGRRPRLDDVDLEMPAGSRVAVIGRPGAGKSTLLRSLAGVEPAAQGTLRWDGEELTGLDALLRTSIRFLPQDPVFPPAPAWHILGLSGPDALESTQVEMLRDVGAWKVIERLPRGLRQKVSSATVSRNEARALALGAVLLGDAPLIVLDAPVDGLKKRTAAKRLQAVARAAAGRTLVVALPRLAGAAGVFDRVVVLRRGRVAFAGSPENWQAWKATRRRKEVSACRA